MLLLIFFRERVQGDKIDGLIDRLTHSFDFTRIKIRDSIKNIVKIGVSNLSSVKFDTDRELKTLTTKRFDFVIDGQFSCFPIRFAAWPHFHSNEILSPARKDFASCVVIFIL